MAKSSYEMNQELQQYQAVHGPVVDDPIVLNPEVDVAPGVSAAGKTANLSPTYRYRFQDGTYLDVKTGGTADDTTYTITGGTAGIKPDEDTSGGAAKTANGYQWNPETGKYDIKIGDSATSRPPEPNVSTSAKQIPVWDETSKSYVWKDNPNYTPPAAPQGRETIAEANAKADYASSLRNQEHQVQLDQQLESDKKRLAWQIETGQITTEQAKQEWQVKLADYQDAKARARAAEEYNRELPFKNAQEARAQAQEARAQEQARLQGLMQQAGIYKDQAERGQAAVDAGVKLGIAAPDAVLRRAYDPYAMLSQIVEQMRTQGIPTPDAQPVGKPVEVPTVTAPSFTAPSLWAKDELAAPSLG